MNKLCPSCKLDKHISEFGKSKSRKDGLAHSCLLCTRKRATAWYQANKATQAKSAAKWYSKNKEQRKRIWTKHHYKKYYGITYEHFLQLVEDQNGKCKICNKDVMVDGPIGSSKAVLDHCHTTGKLRGILCTDCNWGLGNFKDSPEIMLAAIAYIGEQQLKS